MAKFKVGDRVIAKNNTPYTITTNGWKGVVVELNRYHNDIVEVKGKDLNGDICEWWVRDKYFDIDPSFNQKIVITTDGTTTTAKMYHGKTVAATATATCNPDDKFDFETGAKIAFHRLIGFVEPTLESTFDWDAFKNQKIIVKVTKINFHNFVTEANKHALKFHTDGFNPFGEIGEILYRAMMGDACKLKPDEIYVVCEHGNLKVSHLTYGMREYVW